MESMGSQSQTLLCDSHFHFQFERTESLTSNWIFSEKKNIFTFLLYIYPEGVTGSEGMHMLIIEFLIIKVIHVIAQHFNYRIAKN